MGCLSFLSMALRLAPLLSSSFTICKTKPSLVVEPFKKSQKKGIVLDSPPGTHSELHGARRFVQCDPPCSGCSAGLAGPLRSVWHGWQRPHAAASARTCLVRLPRLHASAADPLPSEKETITEGLKHTSNAFISILK